MCVVDSHYSLVSQTGLRLRQDQALLQLGHLRSFYKRVFKKKPYWCLS